MRKLLSVKTFRLMPAVLLLGGMGLYAQPTHVVHADGPDSLFCLKNPDDQACSPDEGQVGDGSTEIQPIPDTYAGPGNNNPQPGYHDNGRGGNTFVNDPCIDPPPPGRARSVQSETEIATFGKYMIAGYNDSYGFYDNTQGLSGFAYSVNGGNTWIDGGGVPPLVKSHSFYTDPSSDHYFGDPVLVVDKSARTFTVDSNGKPLAQPIQQPAGTFYYMSLYSPPGNPHPAAIGTIAVNRSHFAVAPPQTTESVSNTRCLNNPNLQGVPDTTNLPQERPVWEPPSIAVPLVGEAASDFIDKEWMYVSPVTGELYVVYVRFGIDGSTPLEMVRSMDGGRTWTPPTVIVPNLLDTFNTGVQTMMTSTGRLIATWNARTFSAGGFGPESETRIEEAYSDTDGVTWSAPIIVDRVNPQGEPNGYNRGRRNILNAPYIAPETDGTNVYIAYFYGKTALGGAPGPIYTGPLAKQADIYLAASHDNGMTWTRTKVNDDPGLTSHVFPTVQVNKVHDVYVSWLDRRNDPVNNELTDAWAAVSKDGGLTFSPNRLQTDVATSWRVRADARPNMGDYNSSELLNDTQFVMIWNDGRFPPPAPTPQAATPDTIFTIATGLGAITPPGNASGTGTSSP